MFVFKKIWFWVLVFLIVRVATLFSVSIFTDESIYLRWGMWIWSDFNALAVPILNGKAPGTSLIFGIASLFPMDYFTGARIIAGLSALATFVVVALIATRINKNKNNWVFFPLLIFNGFLLFYGGIAISETLVLLIFSVILLVFIEDNGRLTLENACRLGFWIGLGWWVKSTVLLALPCVVFLTFFKKSSLKKWMVFTGVIFLVFAAMYLPVTLFRGAGGLSSYEQREWILSFKDVLTLPWGIWRTNLFTYFNHLLVFLTPMGLVVLSGSFLRQLFQRKINYLWFWFWVPLVIEIIISRSNYSRYIVVVAPVAVLLLWQELESFSNKKVAAFLLSLIILPGVMFFLSPKLFYRYATLMPDQGKDVGNYFIGPTSGEGLRPAADWIKSLGTEKPVNVVFSRESGNPGDTTVIFLKNLKEIHLRTSPTEGLQYFIESGQGADPRFYDYRKMVSFPRFESTPVAVYTVLWKKKQPD